MKQCQQLTESGHTPNVEKALHWTEDYKFARQIHQALDRSVKAANGDFPPTWYNYCMKNPRERGTEWLNKYVLSSGNVFVYETEAQIYMLPHSHMKGRSSCSQKSERTHIEVRRLRTKKHFTFHHAQWTWSLLTGTTNMNYGNFKENADYPPSENLWGYTTAIKVCWVP